MKDILDCIDKGDVLYINGVVEKMIRNYDKRFQYMCLEDDKCENQYKIDGTTYCRGNHKYGI